MNRVGRYELREKIGEGAMAEVWRAHDPSIDRDLAIKLLKPELSADPEYSERFLREAKAAGALAHPAIVTIYDVGEAQGVPYIAMELLDGKTLDQTLADHGRLRADRVLGIAAQLAAALSYAHLSGVVHRDIKPSNIMLAKDGVSIRILDFGIARVTETDVQRSDDEHARTQIGQVLGTPRYMSPEQALGQAVDGRSDLFSVGAVLYELITGKAAFTGSNAAILALQITQQSPPAILNLEPSCPGGLRFLVDKLLAKRPERRFATAAELGRAIAREAKAYETVVSEAASHGRYIPLPVRLTLAMVGVTAVVLALSVGTVLHRQYRAMEHMALVSGSSIAAFVATNAALPSVENAAARPEERDWLPVQAFISAASQDQSVRWMTMVDSEGVIRGSSDQRQLGKRYRTPAGEEVVYRDAKVTATDIRLKDGQSGFRIVHPILYAGRNFGMIEVSISKAELESAAATSRNLLIGLSFIVLTVVGLVSFALARLLSRPVLRLKSAMADAAMGDLDFRISHDRKDEFGRLFDGFNILADVVQERLAAAERPSGGPRPLEATQISLEPASVLKSNAAGTPFDRDFKRSA